MTEPFVQEFEARAGTATAEGPEWLEPIRQAAMERFARSGFPTARDEEWRFTPIGPIVQGSWRAATGATGELGREQLDSFIFGHPDWTTLVFVNGVYHDALSSAGPLPRGVRVASLAEALRSDGASIERHLARHAPVDGSPFTALNTALMREGGVVLVGAGVDLDMPVHLLQVSTAEAAGTVAHPRNLIVVERGARASVIESYVTLAPGRSYWSNSVTEVAVAAGAWLEHTRIQRESEAAFHVGLTQVDQARDSHYRSFSFAMGGALARHNLHVRLNDENIESLMYGLYLTRGEQVVDNHTAIYHDRPNCRSWEVYKGILDGRSRAVFNGKVFVQPEAQKTDAKQTNRNLLLSDGARVDTKPQLEIFADDVKCTHGATVGRLDDLARFYARSRGLSASAAERLLTYAFAAEVAGEVALVPVREELDRLVFERLGSR
ncbi:MAG TPA: Fe-S cluster assembly protein SufD [Gemmatimonadales bacterium]|jgi:Fe-S cluster assembly protein SufD|nr:Fe-S cluster assembly protein SufD [Gemmatimonadales bacterium]